MASITATQEVKLFSDEDTLGTQKVSINTEDMIGTWINVSHSGEELNMSLENWESLVELVNKAKTQI